jgi:hypothetical protein
MITVICNSRAAAVVAFQDRITVREAVDWAFEAHEWWPRGLDPMDLVSVFNRRGQTADPASWDRQAEDGDIILVETNPHWADMW